MENSSAPARSDLKSSLALLLLGYACALLQVPLHLDAAGFGAGYENATVARNLAATGRFSNPFILPTGPTAHVAPLYPWLLAGIFKISGKPVVDVIALLVIDAILLGSIAALLPLLAREVYGTSRPGVFAGILIIFCGRAMPQNEGAFSALLLIASAIATFRAGVISSSLWAGASLLANPSSLLPLALLAVRRGLRFVVLGAVVSLIICSGWILRNQLQLGSPYFIRDNLGLELYLANNDEARAEMVDNPALADFHPTYNREEAMRVAEMGEGAYNRSKLAVAVAWIRDHPKRFASLCAERAFRYWFPAPHEGWPAYSSSLVTLLGIVGIWIGRKHSAALWLTACAVAYSLPFMLLQVDLKYAYPMLWALALPAGFALNAAIERWVAKARN